MRLLNDKQQREVFHFLFLEFLMKMTDPKLYALRGGVNLRFFFASVRYSEDMDLDVFDGSVSTLKKNGFKILNDAPFKRVLKTYGIEDIEINDPAKAKQTATTQRFKLQLVNSNDERFPTKVEFRRVEKDESKIVKELILPEIAGGYRRSSFECYHYNSNTAAVQKIRALGGRTEVQARDIFDLYVFYLAGQLDKKLAIAETMQEEREKAVLALMDVDFESYKSQVVEYLDLKAQSEFGTREMWEKISSTIVGILT